MSSKLIKVVMCDVCGREGATEHLMTLNGSRVEIDLCGDDSGPLAELARLVAAHGRTVNRKASDGPAPARSGRTFDSNSDTALAVLYRTCPICGNVSRTRNATASHVTAHHDKQTLKAAEVAAGRTFACPKCGEVVGSFMSLGQHSKWSGHSLED